jgi:release factor glutamine methyltransferase
MYAYIWKELDSPQEAQWILEHFCTCSFTALSPKKVLTIAQIKNINHAVVARKSGYPLQYILQSWEFYGLSFSTGEGVLIPRPDTETLVEFVLENTDKSQDLKILDLCAGTGCIGIALAKNLPSADFTAVEFSVKAFDYLKENIARHKLDKLDFSALNDDVLSPELAKSIKNADIIVCNPPYLSAEDMDNLQKELTHEPRMALDGGKDGLFFYREITRIWRNSLKPDGKIYYEIGASQYKAVKHILLTSGFRHIRAKKDYCDIIRVISAAKDVTMTSSD